MSISKLRENARISLKGKWGKAAIITLAYLGVFFVIGFITGLFGEDSIITSLLEIASAVIQIPIVLGLIYAFIKLKRNEDIKTFEFLNLGFSNFGRAWKIGFRIFLKLLVPCIGFIIGIILISSSIIMAASATIIGGSSESTVILVFLGTIIYIASMIWLLVRSLLYSLAWYIAYDNPNMTGLEVVNESARIMRGNRGKLLLLELSFIGWAILTVFTFGIGYLWLLPYMQVALVCFYESLAEKNDNNDGNTNNDDAIMQY